MNNTEETKRVCIECITQMLEFMPLEYIKQVYRLTENLYEDGAEL